MLLAETGHSGTFWTYEPKASTRLLNTPAEVDFTPEVTHTALGKGFAATMIALPVVVLLSLLLLWRRSRKRGRIGRKSSVLLRSVYSLILGLGGWFGFHAGTGLLAVVTTIVGAALGANLVLIALDSLGGRSVPERADARRGALTTAES